MRPILVLALSAVLGTGAWLAPGPTQVVPSLRGHCDTLASAKTLQTRVIVQEVPGATEEVVVVLAKDRKYSLDSPTRSVVSDGTTLTVFDKKANTYTRRPVGESVLADLGLEVSTWALLPFFEKDLAKLYTSGTKKGTRKVAGAEADEIAVVTPSGVEGTMYMAKSSGVAIGSQFVRGDKTYIVLLRETKLDGEGVEDALFVFSAPAGASEAKPEDAAPGWATVAPIFSRSCMPCHGEQRADGLDLRTYSATMGSGTVVSGDPKASTLVKSLRGTIQPRMPQGRPPLPEATIKIVEKWIEAGAKE